ncbi:MAG: lipid-A-disaccharide synthase [Pyrinomonadaceae bacterium]|nr:lipid-A-disaccharide synthase [Pyrinomonadaceae bacterium]
MLNEKRRIMLVVGEASGDSHGAKLVESLRKSAPEIDFEFFGTTGKEMRAAGVETVVKADEFAIVGVPEVAKAIPMFLGVLKKLKTAAEMKNPDVAVLIDFPEFNLKLAKALKKRGFKIVYYISPQLWAWRKYRMRTIENHVDLLLTILPFEKDWYAGQGIHNVEYVGNPLAGEVRSALSREEFCKKHGLDLSKPIIALLGGSRGKEVSRILPVLFETATLMSREDKNLQFVNALATTRNLDEVEKAKEVVTQQGIDLPGNLITVQNETYEALCAADAAAVTSGTATLEAAIIGTPLTVVYKGTDLNYRLLRPLISVESFGLVNLIAGRKLAKELIQDDLTAEGLSKELFRLLDQKVNKKMREDLGCIKESLGDGGASKRAAEAILKQIKIAQ